MARTPGRGRRARRDVITSLLLGLASGAAALHGQSAPALQDPSLDWLAHEPGYVTAPLGTLGRVEEAGAGGVDMVLIPGWGFDAGVWEAFVRSNADRYRMFTVTLPGYGGTAAPPMPPEGASYAAATWTGGAERAIVDLIRRENLERPIVVAHFIHATALALRLALDHPDLVGALVVVAGEPFRPFASPDQPDEPLALTAEERATMVDVTWADGWFRTVTRATWDANMFAPEHYSRDPERGRRARDGVAEAPLPVMIRYLLEHLAVDVTPEMAELEVPTLVLVPEFHAGVQDPSIRGLLDTYFRGTWDAIRASFPDAPLRFETIENTGLLMVADRPDRVSRAVASFVAAVRRREAR